jgi:ubiquinone/menaquinone biosynthesis C-methylase UbiE
MANGQYIHGTAPEEQARLQLLNRLTNQPFIQFLNPSKHVRVLDVGCGLGILAREVAEHIYPGEVIGIERSMEQLEAARQLASESQTPADVHLQWGDAYHVDFPDNSFDIVYCRYLLEHVTSPMTVVNEMSRVTKRSGVVVAQENDLAAHIVYPACETFERVWQKFQRLQLMLGGDPYVGRKLYTLFHQAGLRELHTDLAQEVHFPTRPTFAPWIENVIGVLKSAEGELLTQNLVTVEEFSRAIAELEAFAKRDDACVYFYWNRIKGRKP